jgi:hypothetical protein
VFIAWDFGSFYVGMVPFPASKPNAGVFSPPESQSGTDAATTAGTCGVQYIGFHTVESTAALDDEVMDVMDVLSHFESHLEL